MDLEFLMNNNNLIDLTHIDTEYHALQIIVGLGWETN